MVDEYGGRDMEQQELIRRQSKCRTAIEEMWDDGDVQMCWKNGNRLGKYQQVMTKNLIAYHRYDN